MEKQRTLPAVKRSLLAALLRQRCPRCRDGKLFRTALDMHKACPVCGVKWEREEGYFIGALYFSYALAIAFLSAAMLAWHLLLPDVDLGWAALLAILTFLPFVPAAFRYSRVLWIYLDRLIWPDNHPG